MTKRVISHNPDSGITTYYDFDAGTGQSLVWDEQNCDAIIESNKRWQTADRGRFGDGLGDKVASIPLIVYFDLLQRGILQDQKKLRKWLNSSDNLYFRTNRVVV